MVTQLKQTALHRAHLALNSRMVDFAGWDLPVMYGGILDEVRAVRNDVGIFDISHMGRLRVSGQGATALLQLVTSNDVASLQPSHAHYSLLTNPTGGIIDDIIVYRAGPESYLVILNASNADKDIAWMHTHAGEGVVLDDRTADTAMIAVQGPHAPQLVAQLAARPELLNLSRFQYGAGQIDGVETTFCRTGYTGGLVGPPKCRSCTVWTRRTRRASYRSGLPSVRSRNR
jgi:aminomethyltransferase